MQHNEGVHIMVSEISVKDVQEIAAFSRGVQGGNPAGVWIGNEMPAAAQMQALAKEVGFSETVFSVKDGDKWRTRYFSPQSEVPFCGHATIALGAVLAMEYGDGDFALKLNDADISVRGTRQGDQFSAALVSPPTQSRALTDEEETATLALFGLADVDLDHRLPPAFISAGATHFVLTLSDRKRLAAMEYDFAAGQRFMRERGLVTIALICFESDTLIHARNAFASGGVVEDPATGAAAAALGGYLRDAEWPHQGGVTIIQGEDMGAPSEIHVEVNDIRGAPVVVSGAARIM